MRFTDEARPVRVDESFYGHQRATNNLRADVIETGEETLLLVQLRSFEVPPQDGVILEPRELQKGRYGKLLEGQIDSEDPTNLCASSS